MGWPNFLANIADRLTSAPQLLTAREVGNLPHHHMLRHYIQKPSGCVVWIGLNTDTLELGPFMWFGGIPGEPLPDISVYQNSKLATHNAAPRYLYDSVRLD